MKEFSYSIRLLFFVWACFVFAACGDNRQAFRDDFMKGCVYGAEQNFSAEYAQHIDFVCECAADLALEVLTDDDLAIIQAGIFSDQIEQSRVRMKYYAFQEALSQPQGAEILRKCVLRKVNEKEKSSK